MTDAFSEYAGGGNLARDANLGLMTKNRFRAAMGTIFKGIDLSSEVLNAICTAYGTGGPDPAEPGTQVKVMWKRFAIEFDEIPLPTNTPSDYDEVLADAALVAELSALKAEAANKRLDLTDFFSEYAGTGRDANLGIMPKNRFRSAMGSLFEDIGISNTTLGKVCKVYATGDPDPHEPGTCFKVFWKQFAIDFDDKVPMPPPPPNPDPTDEIMPAMLAMNEYCNKNGIDLANDIEEYLGGKDKCASDVMPREKFKQALGVLFGRAASLYTHDEATLNLMCKAYAGGKREARRPEFHESVQWREFAHDVARIKEMPYLRWLNGEVEAYPQRGQLCASRWGNAE